MLFGEDGTLSGELPTSLTGWPTRIEALRGIRVRCIAAGRMHSCAVTDEGHVYNWGDGRRGELGHMGFEGEQLPKRVETLYDNGTFAVGVAAGIEHTMVAGADGAVWGFGLLNGIGAWNDPTVKAMRDAAGDVAEDDFPSFGRPEYEVLGSDCAGFLFPHGRSSISMPVRIPVNVRGPVLQEGGAPFI
jgi:hypothetical protein